MSQKNLTGVTQKIIFVNLGLYNIYIFSFIHLQNVFWHNLGFTVMII